MKSKESKSRKKNEEAPEETLEKPRKTLESKPKMALTSWFGLKLSEKALRPTQRLEIEIFMKKQGLSEMEEKEKYDKAYSRF